MLKVGRCGGTGTLPSSSLGQAHRQDKERVAALSRTGCWGLGGCQDLGVSSEVPLADLTMVLKVNGIAEMATYVMTVG